MFCLEIIGIFSHLQDFDGLRLEDFERKMVNMGSNASIIFQGNQINVKL
jgi:hypothetical protein